MRVFFAILLSVLLSLNFFFYSDELLGYSVGMVGQSTVNKVFINDLKRLGYYRNEFKDENLNFRNAVLRFQSHNNITADGIAGKQFKSALEKRLKMGKTAAYADYVKNPACSKMWIVVNKSKRTLTVYWNKTAIEKYPVALGRANYITPEGKFRVKTKVINPAWSGGGYAEPVSGGSKDNPLGYRWLGLSIGNKNKYGIHGNNNPYSIGRNVSRGCIRMLNTDIGVLFDYVEKGTPVWIGTDKQLRKWGIDQNSVIN